MSRAHVVKPNHKAVQRYYATLREYHDQRVKHEGALETGFQRLLADTAQAHGWTLLPKLKLQVKGKNIYPDGTLRDLFNMRRGFWEAKDLGDDLDVEIGKKIAKAYPTSHTIFEDTQRAVLYQGGVERNRFDLTKTRKLADLLNDFYAYTEPEIDNFHQAVEEFKERVPELAKGLVEKIADAHKTNKNCQSVIDGFFTLGIITLNGEASQPFADGPGPGRIATRRGGDLWRVRKYESGCGSKNSRRTGFGCVACTNEKGRRFFNTRCNWRVCTTASGRLSFDTTTPTVFVTATRFIRMVRRRKRPCSSAQPVRPSRGLSRKPKRTGKGTCRVS
jgi:hypothetical protein